MEYTKEQVEALLFRFHHDESKKRLDEYFSRRSIFDILGVERKETYHSSFIAWLFDDSEMGCLACKQFLFLLLQRSKQFQKSHFPEKIKRGLLTGALTIDKVTAEPEVTVSNGRADIVLTVTHTLSNKPLVIVIENKIYSTEHSSQTKTYFDHYATSRRVLENLIFVYLTPLNPIDGLSEVECECKKYIQINYQDLYEKILLPLKNNAGISQNKRNIIEEYVLSLTTNYNSKSTSMMVMPQELSELLEEFFNNNQELIELAQNAAKNGSSRSSRRKKGAKTLSWQYYTDSIDGIANQHVFRILGFDDGTRMLEHRLVRYWKDGHDRSDWEEIKSWKRDDNYPLELNVNYIGGNNRRDCYIIVTYKDNTSRKIRFDEQSEDKIVYVE